MPRVKRWVVWRHPTTQDFDGASLHIKQTNRKKKLSKFMLGLHVAISRVDSWLHTRGWKRDRRGMPASSPRKTTAKKKEAQHGSRYCAYKVFKASPAAGVDEEEEEVAKRRRAVTRNALASMSEDKKDLSV